MTWIPVSDWEKTFVWFPRFDHNGTLLWGTCERCKVKLHSNYEYDGTRYRYRRFFAGAAEENAKQTTEADKIDNLLNEALTKTEVDIKIKEARKNAMVECMDMALRSAKSFDNMALQFDKEKAPTLALVASAKAFGCSTVASNIEVKLIREFPEMRNWLLQRDIEEGEQKLVDAIDGLARVHNG